MDYKTVEIGENIYYEKFVRRVANRTGLKYSKTKDVVDDVFAELKALLLYYATIHISHFGKFFVKKVPGLLMTLTLEEENKENKVYVEAHYNPKLRFNRAFAQQIRETEKDLEKFCTLE